MVRFADFRSYADGTIIRILLFILVSYFIVPKFVLSMTPYFGLDRYPYINFLNAPLFFFYALVIFWIVKRKEFSGYGFCISMKESLAVFMMFAVSFLSFLFLGKLIDSLYVLGFKSQFFNYAIVYAVLALVFVFLFLLIFGIGFIRAFRKNIIVILVSTIFYYLLSLLLAKNGILFSVITAKITYVLLSMNYDNLFFDHNISGDPVIVIDNFPVTVGIPCSGIESMALFISISIVLIMLTRTKADKLPAFFVGLAVIFLLNIIRVYFLIHIALSMSKASLDLFHTNLGWLFFALFYAVFIRLVYSGGLFSEKKKVSGNTGNQAGNN